MQSVSGRAQRPRVAILGGGAAGMATAFELSETGGYDITVYQMGWRLGGKCASGRRLEDHSGRDQEHGLHVLGGFYHNAMGMLRKVYAAWPAASQHPIAFQKAFLPQSRVHIMEEQPDARFPVLFPFPPNTRQLGLEPQDLTLGTIAMTIIGWISHVVQLQPEGQTPRGAPFASKTGAFAQSVQAALEQLSAEPLIAGAPASPGPLDQMIDIIHQAQFLPPPANAEHDPDYGILFEIAAVVVKGFILENMAVNGFEAANGVEFTTWMTKYGLSDYARQSSYFRCGYDYAFAYVDGDPAKPRVAAGAALRGFLRMVMTYNTSVFVHMCGGMGEIVFAPLYEVLKQRDVAFKFFHRVDQIVLDDTQSRVAEVLGTMQNDPIETEYNPLEVYRGRMVFPDRPIAGRLKHNPPIPSRPEFLYETPWNQPPNSGAFRLEADTDFDVCVLAIPIEALKTICADFPTPWPEMLSASATAPTIAAQLWQGLLTKDLGWPNGATVLTADREPLSTWADMSFLLPLEAPSASKHLSYFCGPFPQHVYPIPPANVGDLEIARGSAAVAAWMNQNLAELLPAAHPPNSFAPKPGGDELYVRVNFYPSERYTLTPPGSVAKRLAPGASGLDNLCLAGDWTKNGFDIGSYETAVASALLCAKAVGEASAQLLSEGGLAV
ncbi:MAG TPA: NAD(P)-binding protein [Caulobacteraceae bacterium]|jgi:uncharacterized protein with NAD-binding domain and iron-sulfur cluster